MLQRPKFEDHIAFPYVRHMSPEGTLGDIFDGRIGKTYVMKVEKFSSGMTDQIGDLDWHSISIGGSHLHTPSILWAPSI